MTSVNAPPDDPLFEKVSSLLTKLTSKASSEAVRSGAAKQLVGSVYEAAAGAVTSTSVTPGSSVGAVLENYSVLENLMAAANYAHADAAGTAARLGAWTAIDQLLLSSCSSSTSSSPSPPPSAAVVKGVLEPVLLPLLGSWMLPRIGAESKAPVRAVALRAAARLVRLAGPVVGAASVLPTLLFHANAAESGSKWPAQQAALVLMRELVASNGCGCEDQLLPLLPSLVPALSDAIHSIQPEVSEAAVETCTLLCVQVIANPDVEKVLPDVVKCIGDPALVPETIDKLSQTTFVKAVRAPLLAVMIPLLARGLAERSNAVKRRCAVIIDNMCRLVPSASDILPFLPDLLPGLQRIVDIGGDPEMIAVTARALITLFRVSGKPVPKDLVEAADYDASKPVISSLTHTTTERDLEKMRLDSRNEAVKARQAKRETELEQLVADIKLNDEDDAAADTLNSPGGTVMARGGSSSSSKSSNVITLTPWAIHDVVVDEITKHTSIVCPPSIDMKRKCVLDVIRYICSVIELVLKAEVYDSDEWEEHYVAPFLVDLLIVPPPTTEDTSNTTTTSDSASAASHANAAANSITRKILHRLRLMTGYKGSSGDSEEGDEGEDGIKHLADCQFSLGYGGMVLLRKTRLRLKRGSRYGLCGHNGCGKTTLLTAIAKGQVDGWPSANEVKSVLVAHDFAADGDETAAAKSILDVMSDDPNLAGLVARDVISTQLSSLGFTDLMLTMPVAALSGGWKMKLGLARAMLMKADILLLDEPTNHLDVTNVEWLVNYLTGLTNVTSLIVSHDTKFLDNVCDHIVHYEKKKLKTYKGNLSEFVKVKPEAMTYYTLSHAPTKFIFPRPGNLDGVNSKFKPVLRLKNVQFQYPGSERIALNNVSASCCLASRIAVIGANGAGKSTLIKVLTGERVPQAGTVWKHPTVRVTYVAQHPLEYLEKHLDKTPNEYVQWRFQNGEDKELAMKQSRQLTKEEEQQMAKEIIGKNGQSRRIEKLIGRSKLKKSFQYEVKWLGLDDKKNSWVPRETLEEWGFIKLCQAYDDKASLREGLSGFGAKEITQTCIQQHFEDFGLEPQFSTYGKIRGLSGGQKIKTVLASAMWGNPHMLILDEPTNYLDRESLAAFAEAIKNFEGGVVIISHHAEFLSELCSEHWNMENGVLTIGGKAAAVEEEDNNNMSSSMISEDGQSVTSSLGSGDLLNNDASSNGSVSVKAGGSEGGSSTVLVDDNVDKLMNQKGPIGGKVLGKNGKPMSRKQLKELAYEQELDRLIALGIMPPRK